MFRRLLRRPSYFKGTTYFMLPNTVKEDPVYHLELNFQRNLEQTNDYRTSKLTKRSSFQKTFHRS